MEWVGCRSLLAMGTHLSALGAPPALAQSISPRCSQEALGRSLVRTLLMVLPPSSHVDMEPKTEPPSHSFEMAAAVRHCIGVPHRRQTGERHQGGAPLSLQMVTLLSPSLFPEAAKAAPLQNIAASSSFACCSRGSQPASAAPACSALRLGGPLPLWACSPLRIGGSLWVLPATADINRVSPG